MKDSKAKSKVMILLTDGANNFGDLAPRAAADAIAQLGIKSIYYRRGQGRHGSHAGYHGETRLPVPR